MKHLPWDPGSDTSTATFANTGTAGTTTLKTQYLVPHTCCIKRLYARGNQHRRTEYGSCRCGKEFTRSMDWGSRTTRDWRPA